MVHRCCMHLDQDIVVTYIRLRHISGAQAFLFSVAVGNKDFHGFSFLERVQETKPARQGDRDVGMMVIILNGKKTSP